MLVHAHRPQLRPGSLIRALALLALPLVVTSTCGAASEPAQPETVRFSAAERQTIATLSPRALPPPARDRSNRFADDPAAAEFGRQLFFDKRFSGALLDGDNDGSVNSLGRKGDTGRVACAGCHVPESGFLDSRTLGRSISLGSGWGRRHAPSLLDVGQAKLLMWDGRRDALHNQIFEVIESPVEMNSSRLFAAQQLARNHRQAYERVFGRMPRFDDPAEYPQIGPEQTGCHPSRADVKAICDGPTHGMPGDKAEFDRLPNDKQDEVTRAVANMGKALGSYQRKLTCGPGRFDAWAHGQTDALSASEQRGLKLFIGKAKCATCHSGPYFSDQGFHNVGLIPATVAVSFRDVVDDGAHSGIGLAAKDPLNSRGLFSDGDDGRLPKTASETMKGAYKTPMLRCVGKRLAFMRTGQIRDLRAVVEFFDRGGSRDRLVGQNELMPLGLDATEKDDLVSFLRALDGPGPNAELLKP